MKKEKPIKIFILEFKGIDFWNRPVFKVKDKSIYFGSTNILFPNKKFAPNDMPQEIINFFKKYPEQIEYFGTKFDCEPNGGRADNWRYEFIDIKYQV